MEKIIGLIEKVETATGITKKEGKAEKPWKRFCFTINGNKYSTFSASIGDNYIVGMNVVMEGEESNGYWNMKTMVAASDEEHAKEYAKAGISEEPKQTSQTSVGYDRNNSIIAQCMVKAAAEICSSHIVEFQASKLKIYEITIDCVKAYKVALKELNNGA